MLKVVELHSRCGDRYLGVEIERALVLPDLHHLVGIVEQPDLDRMLATRVARDGTGFHMTVVTPPEMNELRDVPLTSVSLSLSTLTFLGVGSVRSAQPSAVAYFSVVECQPIQDFRASLGLPSAGLHVTLGFDPHDIHGVTKDRTTLVAPR